MTVNVVVLAGGKNSTEMQAVTGVKNRALTPLGDRAMLDYVTLALSDASSVGSIYVVGDVPASNHYQVVTGEKTLLDNLLAGINAAQAEKPQERVLVSTSDIPFLTAESVEDFVNRAIESGGDLCCSYVPVSLCYAKYPDMKRTAIKVKEGQMTLGNLMLVNPRFLLAHHETISRAYAARKSPLQIAQMLGFGMLARLLLAQLLSPSLLTLGMLEQSVSRLLGHEARAVGIESAYPEIGTDVDRPDDVALARRLLAASPQKATR
jgi:GTP:adenosylcobinamide-phosphate guanylyltransferase